MNGVEHNQEPNGQTELDGKNKRSQQNKKQPKNSKKEVWCKRVVRLPYRWLKAKASRFSHDLVDLKLVGAFSLSQLFDGGEALAFRQAGHVSERDTNSSSW